MKMKNVEDIYPLSPMQQTMLAHSIYAPASRVSLEQSCDLLQGTLNLTAFVQAWQQVIQKYATLRTCFISKVVDEPLQIVRQHIELPLQQFDWRHQSEVEQDTQLKQLLQEDLERGFELEKAPLMRMVLIRKADDAYYFIWSFHHIILDGWSKSIVLNDVFAYYTAYVHDREIPMEYQRPYRDYISWLQAQDMPEAERVWRRALQGFTAPTRLPLARASVQKSSGEHPYKAHQLQCSAATTAALRLQAQKSLVTLNVLIQGTWSLLLSHCSGENDVVFGVTVSGRPQSLVSSGSMVGLFINILPVRIRIRRDISIRAWMQNIQTWQLGMDQFSYCPLMRVQEWSEVPWNHPLFESLLVFENYPSESESSLVSDTLLEAQNVYGMGKTNHALTVVVDPGEELSLSITYDCHYFDDHAIEKLADAFHNIMQKIACSSATDHVGILLDGIQDDALVQRWDQAIDTGNVADDRCAPSIRQPFAAPRTTLELQLTRIWEEILHIHPIGIDDDFFAMGGHSLSALRLATQIRKQSGQGFPISLLAQLSTIRQLAQALQKPGAFQSQSPIVALQTQGSGMPFFCIHPGSGNILCYSHLVHHLGSDQPFYAIHDLDIHEDVFPEVSIEEMAERYLKAIRAIQPIGPYALGGFSFGGIVAFEMAQQLSMRGQEVGLLALLDSGSPLSSQGFENNDNAGFLSVITMEAIRGSSQKSVEEVYDDLQALSLDEQLRYVVEQMQQAGYEPPSNGPLGVRHELTIYQTRTRVIQQYKAKVYPGTIALFQAQDHDKLAQKNSLSEDWQRFSARPIDLYTIPGYHDTILDEHQVQVLAEKLRRLINESNQCWRRRGA